MKTRHTITLGGAPIAMLIATTAIYSTSVNQAMADQPGATSRSANDRHGFTPLSMQEFDLLKKSVLFTDDDVKYLRMSRGVLEPNVDDLLDVWYGFVGSNEHLVYYFGDRKTGEPNGEYLGKVRTRFRQWVLDTADADFDEAWLSKQLEIGLRHHRLKKNQTDNVDSVPVIHFRHLVALHYPITTTIKPFLAKGDHSEEEIQGMYEAWRKAVLMTAILWSQPYVSPQDF